MLNDRILLYDRLFLREAQVSWLIFLLYKIFIWLLVIDDTTLYKLTMQYLMEKYTVTYSSQIMWLFIVLVCVSSL